MKVTISDAFAGADRAVFVKEVAGLHAVKCSHIEKGAY